MWSINNLSDPSEHVMTIYCWNFNFSITTLIIHLLTTPWTCFELLFFLWMHQSFENKNVKNIIDLAPSPCLTLFHSWISLWHHINTLHALRKPHTWLGFSGIMQKHKHKTFHQTPYTSKIIYKYKEKDTKIYVV